MIYTHYSIRRATDEYKRKFAILVKALDKSPDEFERVLRNADPDVRNGEIHDVIGVQHVDFNVCNEELIGANIVHYACLNPCTDYLRVLLKLEPDIFNQHLLGRAYNGEHGNTPLHVAFKHNPELIPLLLMRVTNTRYLSNFDGNTPLDIALLHNIKSVENFLNSSCVTAEDLMKYDNDSWNKSSMLKECVEYLESHPKYRESRRLRDAERNLRFEK